MRRVTTCTACSTSQDDTGRVVEEHKGLDYRVTDWPVAFHESHDDEDYGQVGYVCSNDCFQLVWVEKGEAGWERV